jgi:GAF domain-containing protein
VAPAECPGCGAPLAGTQRRRAPSAAAYQPNIESVLAVAREMLAMDVAMVSEITDDAEIARHAVGEWPPVGSLEGLSLPIGETLCARMLDGTLSNVVCDARTDERIRDLSMIRDMGVGAWMGVPMATAARAHVYVLCCLSREARPTLGEREVYALKAIAQTLGDQLR